MTNDDEVCIPSLSSILLAVNSIVQFLRANNHATESTETFRNLFVACRILRGAVFSPITKGNYGIEVRYIIASMEIFLF